MTFRNLMKNIILIYLLPVIFSLQICIAQTGPQNVSKTGTKAATFLEIPVGAAALGMGNAYVSLANDATALYWNVAGIALFEKNEILGVHSRWIADINFNFAGIVLALSEYGSIGLSLTSLTMDDMKVRTVQKPNGTGEFFEAQDFAIGLSYARKLSDRFAVGITIKYIEEKIWHMKANAFAIDFGTTFRTDLFGGMTIGLTLYNFGTSLILSGRDTRTFGRVDDAKLGSNERIPYNIEMEAWDLPLFLQFGVSADAIKSESYRWTLAIDALHPSDNYESINIGTEFGFKEFLFIRGGYQALFLDDTEGGMSFGLGLQTGMLFSKSILKFDYAFRDMGRLDNTQFFSLAIIF